MLGPIVLTIVEHEEPATARLVAATCYTAKGADALRRLMPILIEEYVVHEVVEKVKEHFFDAIFLSDFRRLMARNRQAPRDPSCGRSSESERNERLGQLVRGLLLQEHGPGASARLNAWA